jgi:hypothetical protein
MAAFDCAKTTAVLEEGICALLRTGHERRDYVAFEIDLEESLGLGGLTAGLAHQGGISGIVPLQKIRLVLLQRGTAVPHYAALALAHPVIAGEIFSEDILGNEAVIDLYDGSETVPGHILI